MSTMRIFRVGHLGAVTTDGQVDAGPNKVLPAASSVRAGADFLLARTLRRGTE